MFSYGILYCAGKNPFSAFQLKVTDRAAQQFKCSGQTKLFLLRFKSSAADDLSR
jgi:hypothetical protein